MASLSIELPTNRSPEDVYADVALKNGYQDKITEKTHKRENNILDTWTEPENAEEVRYISNDDGTTDVEYTLVEKVDNPESKQEFGERKLKDQFEEIDVRAETEATKLRARKRYEEG